MRMVPWEAKPDTHAVDSGMCLLTLIEKEDPEGFASQKNWMVMTVPCRTIDFSAVYEVSILKRDEEKERGW